MVSALTRALPGFLGSATSVGGCYVWIYFFVFFPCLELTLEVCLPRSNFSHVMVPALRRFQVYLGNHDSPRG